MIARYSKLISLIVVALGVVGLFQVKYKVLSLQTEVASLTKELEGEKEALHVAAAEWAYLNRPERLQVLSDKYLAMGAIATAQITEVVNVPIRESQLAKDDGDAAAPEPVASAAPAAPAGLHSVSLESTQP